MSLPRDETTPWGTDGVRAYWQGEATAGTPTKPVLGRSEYKLKKLMALVPVTNELLSDATALSAYIPPNCARSIR
jgi:HK97 family phage major capsid protein